MTKPMKKRTVKYLAVPAIALGALAMTASPAFAQYGGDTDGDGISDIDEMGSNPNDPWDSDGDGTPDYLDTDSDNDGYLDATEGLADLDGDGIADLRDPDSNGGAATGGTTGDTGGTTGDTGGTTTGGTTTGGTTTGGTTTGEETLAFTGVNSGEIAAVGAVAVALGGVAARRSRQQLTAG